MTSAVIMLFLMNLLRTSDHQLALNADLSHRAQIRAEQLCADGQWSHDGWRASFDGIKDWGAIGENLARSVEGENINNAFAAENALEQSPSHHENLVSPLYTQLGVGEVFTENCHIWVQLFDDVK